MKATDAGGGKPRAVDEISRMSQRGLIQLSEIVMMIESFPCVPPGSPKLTTECREVIHKHQFYLNRRDNCSLQAKKKKKREGKISKGMEEKETDRGTEGEISLMRS